MDIFFQDPTEIPLPPSEVRIRKLNADPWPDGQRVRVILEVDPFQKKPSAEVRITNSKNEVKASASIVETMTRKMEFTMHLRGDKDTGQHTLAAVLFYSQTEENPEDEENELPRQTYEVVDRAETHFMIDEPED